MKQNNKAFTLVEILVAILISTTVLLVGFQTYTMASITKIKLIEQTDLQKSAFYFSEKFFQLIKEGGTIDYEEYFNRKVLNAGYTSTTDLYMSGHYKQETGFGNYSHNGILGPSGNYGAGFYYCASGNGVSVKMGDSGCFNSANNILKVDGNVLGSGDMLGKKQNYGQYRLQFIDYNSDADASGDEDNNGNIIGDDDDLELGKGPEVFSAGEKMKEIYLISGNGRERTIFRRNVKQDPDALPSAAPCTANNANEDGCLGRIEFLKLTGKDWGMNHKAGELDSTQNDGIIDTWVVHEDFDNLSPDLVVAGSTTDVDQYFKPLFPDNVNVTSFSVFLYPNKDPKYAWDEDDPSINIAPYLRVSYSIKPSWKIKSKIKGEIKEQNFSTTIHLTDIYSK